MYKKNKFKNYLADRFGFKFILIAAVSAILFFIPQLIWKNYGYFVGGDDSLLQYMYPDQMIEKFAKNIAVNNTLSGPEEYVERLDLLPILYLISIVNHITRSSNSLYIFLGFILSASFLSFMFFIDELEPKHKNNYFIEKLFISLLYTFFIHHYLSVMNYKLLVMYIVFLVPFVLALFFKAINEGKSFLLIPAALVSSLFSVVLVGIPWLFAYLISASSLVLYLFVKDKKRFLSYLIKLILLVVIMNIYWIYHFVYSIFSNTSETNVFSGIITQEFRANNINAILSVTNQNVLLDSMLGLFHPNLQKNFNWESYKIFENWHSHFIILNVLILFFIFVATILYKRRKKNNIFPFAMFGWLVSLYFFTANMFGVFGIRLFLFMNKVIPGFSMFRNNYDKFASGFAFSFSILLFVTTMEIKQNKMIPEIIKKIWTVILICFVTVTTYPVIMGKFERNLIVSTEKTKARIEQLDHRFIDFSFQIKKFKNNSIIWMPLSKASYVVIKDEFREDFVYAGISPLLFLSDIHDYTGILSFRTDKSKLFSAAIESQNSDQFGQLLKEMGITYIAINNTLSQDIKDSYIYGDEFIKKQNQNFMKNLLGEKVTSVGNDFVLYKVNDKYFQEQFYFLDGCIVDDINLISRETYKIKYSLKENETSPNCQLIFKQPYHKMWYLEDNGVVAYSSKTSLFQNSWILPNRSSSGELLVSFKPRKYVAPLFLVSGLSIIASIAFYIKKISEK